MMTNPNLILVTGANGTTGRRVADRLTSLGIPVRRGSRSGAPPFDWHDETTWGPVLDGVSAAYLVYSPDLVAPGAVDAVRRFTAAAVSAGVRRLVLLSGRGEAAAREAERVVLGSGVDAVIVRCSFFAQNFSEKGFEEFVRHGTVALPAPEVGEPFVDVEDIADVVVAALTGDGHAGDGRTGDGPTVTAPAGNGPTGEAYGLAGDALTGDGHAGRVYELTGGRLLTFAEAVAEIAKATGRDIEYLRISGQEFVAGLTAQGVPPDEAQVFADIFGTVLDGRNAHLTDGVRRALGRAPRDFADYARTAAATGVWDR
jgi:uncharacterized protein YbjT (DUF2867 family)